MSRPPGPTQTGVSGTCTKDADCNDASQGQNGRCTISRIGYSCTYDSCFDDSPCKGKVCLCRPQETTASATTNHCLTEGNCRLDSDCGAGMACSPSFGSCGHYFGVVAYYCHTSNDACVNDTDCGNGGVGSGYCAYNPAAGFWQCSTAECVG